MGPLVARVMKILLHFYLVFTTGITFSYLVNVSTIVHLQLHHVCHLELCYELILF